MAGGRLINPSAPGGQRRAPNGGHTGAEMRDIDGMGGGVRKIARTAPASQVFYAHNGREIAIRSAKIINRAERGSTKGLPWYGRFDGETYPSDVDTNDKTTWLQPGESIVVPIDVALHICGDFLSPLSGVEQEAMASKYGGWEYEGVKTGALGHARAQSPIGPPIFAPDLIVVIVDDRGTELSKPVAVWDHYFSPEVKAYFDRENPAVTKPKDDQDKKNRLARYQPA